jgi:hypothetical protein
LIGEPVHHLDGPEHRRAIGEVHRVEPDDHRVVPQRLLLVEVLGKAVGRADEVVRHDLEPVAGEFVLVRGTR